MNASTRKLLLVTAAGAVAAMGTVTLAAHPGTTAHSGGVAIVADTETQTTPPPKPAIPSAAPTMKSSPWKGGDWPGS